MEGQKPVLTEYVQNMNLDKNVIFTQKYPSVQHKAPSK